LVICLSLSWLSLESGWIACPATPPHISDRHFGCHGVRARLLTHWPLTGRAGATGLLLRFISGQGASATTDPVFRVSSG
jgi:hypothetical protein